MILKELIQFVNDREIKENEILRSGELKEELLERVNTFNSNFGISNPHPDEKDNAKRFDSKILPILEKLENAMKYGN